MEALRDGGTIFLLCPKGFATQARTVRDHLGARGEPAEIVEGREPAEFATALEGRESKLVVLCGFGPASKLFDQRVRTALVATGVAATSIRSVTLFGVAASAAADKIQLELNDGEPAFDDKVTQRISEDIFADLVQEAEDRKREQSEQRTATRIGLAPPDVSAGGRVSLPRPGATPVVPVPKPGPTSASATRRPAATAVATTSKPVATPVAAAPMAATPKPGATARAAAPKAVATPKAGATAQAASSKPGATAQAASSKPGATAQAASPKPVARERSAAPKRGATPQVAAPKPVATAQAAAPKRVATAQAAARTPGATPLASLAPRARAAPRAAASPTAVSAIPIRSPSPTPWWRVLDIRRLDVNVLVSFVQRRRWVVAAVGGAALTVLVTGLALAGGDDDAVVADAETPEPAAAHGSDPSVPPGDPAPTPQAAAVVSAPEPAAAPEPAPAPAIEPAPAVAEPQPEPAPAEPPPEAAVAEPEAEPAEIRQAEQAAVKRAIRRRIVRALDTLLISPVSSKRRTWTQSNAYCEELDVAGVGGWRLPEVGELVTLKGARLIGRRVYWSRTVGDSYGGRRLAYHGKRRRILSMSTKWSNGRTVCVRER